MDSSRWKPIQDLPSDWGELTPSGLESLAEIWKERAEQLKDSESLKVFNERLNREWAIETGIIENLYTLDRGLTQTLVEKGIAASLFQHGDTDRPVEQVVSFLQDQQSTVEGLFAFVKQERALSVSYIKELHAVLTRHQDSTHAVDELGHAVEVDLIRGDWKKQPNNPKRPDGTIHEYCSPEQVASEMDRLVEWHLAHVEQGVSPEVEAAWLHHRFTQIHPFQDGNGRVARAVASLVFIRAGYFPLVIHRDARSDYIDALENADGGDLLPLIQLFSSIQNRSFTKALSLSDNVLLEGEPVQQVISSAMDRIRVKEKPKIEEWFGVIPISRELEAFTHRKLEEIVSQLNDELIGIQSDYRSTALNVTVMFRENSFKKIAHELDYNANTSDYSKLIMLRIDEERIVGIFIAFHGLGVDFQGVLAVSALLEYDVMVFDEKDNTTKRITDGPYKLCDEVFQFSYKEDENTVLERFKPWLEKVIVVGLDQWRRQL